MAGSIAIPKPHLRLSDPAEAQRPLTFYVRAVRRRWVMITLLSLALTALVVLVCAMLPPVSVGSATIAIDRQAAPHTHNTTPPRRALTALGVLVCAMLPPVSVGSATIAIDRQAAPETIGDNH